MNISTEDIRKKLTEKGLKITPQRISILEAVYTLNNHPTAENIIECIHGAHPNIATGTVYKVLETLVDNQIIQKVKTDKDIMRYEGVTEKHHHLYCSDCDMIKDYFDEELDALLKDYFEKKQISDFKIEDIILQINGTFTNDN